VDHQALEQRMFHRHERLLNFTALCYALAKLQIADSPRGRPIADFVVRISSELSRRPQTKSSVEDLSCAPVGVERLLLAHTKAIGICLKTEQASSYGSASSDE
jgi:hypothetical protein